MAIITIKTSQSNNAPSALANGELAYSYSSDKLFIGQTDTAGSPISVEYIGGKLLVDKVANLESIVFGGAGSGLDVSEIDVTERVSLSYAPTTANHVMMARADGVIDFINGATGKILQIAANGSPVFGDLNGGAY